MTLQKIDKIGNFYRIHCNKIDGYRDARDCEKCKKFAGIDPVRREIKCREV
jgi:hypothetical protein